MFRLRGLVQRWGGPRSDRRLINLLPSSLVEAVGGRKLRPLRPSPPPKFHHMFDVGGTALLHVYKPELHPEILRSVGERQQLERRTSLFGPRLLAAEAKDPYAFVLEERLHGRACHQRDRERWWDEAVTLLADLSAFRFAPLAETPFWNRYRAQTLEYCPPGLEGALDRAWQQVGSLPAVPLHGDVQPQNLVRTEHGMRLVDWEGFWLAGLPGLDLMFLATMTGEVVPRTDLVSLCDHEAANGHHPLARALQRCGVDKNHVPATTLVALSLWQVGEARRNRRAGTTGGSQPSPFAAMLALAARRFP